MTLTLLNFYLCITDPSRGKRIARRWYVPPSKMRYDQEYMPAEWDGKECTNLFSPGVGRVESSGIHILY